jgi:hypothetical protein
MSVSVERQQVRRAGALCLSGGLLGVGAGIVTLLWSPQVPEERFSYPFDEFWFVIAELVYAFQHVLLVAGGVALLWLPAVRASRTARIATRVAVAGLVLLVIAELSALSLYDAAIDSTLTTVITSLFTLPILFIGVGLTVAGIALLRRRVADGTPAQGLSIAVLAPGAYVFVALVPLVNQPDPVGRLSIGGWMLLFAVLGYALIRESKEATRPRG